jgi:two-component system cell cycle response regulator DivK
MLKDRTIYVVEDNENNIYVLSLVLRHQGARLVIDWWAKGEVRRLVDALPIDLIILDLMLPGKRSGYDVFEEIRGLSQFDGIPIVAVSAVDHTLALPKVRQMGFAGFISKPIDVELFPEQIKRLIEGEEVWYTGQPQQKGT